MKHPLRLAMSVALVLGLTGDAQIAPPATLPSDLAEQIHEQIAAAESTVTQPSAFNPAAKALARLCQSDPFFFLDEPDFRPAWTPPQILKLGPTWVQITAKDARVEFGGGFHHFGYELTLNESAGDKTQNSWTLSFYSEDSPSKPLTTFKLKKTDHVDRAQFVSGALAKFQRDARANHVSDQLVNERLVFLLKFDEVEKARASIRGDAAANPRDWLDQLLAYIIDARTDPAASTRLDAWVQKTGDFSACLMAAYACGIAGDDNAMERQTKAALARPVDDPDWLDSNARFRGATVCRQLLVARRYQTCAALCDALLSYKDSGSYLAPRITSIRDLARRATGAGSPPAFDDGTIFNPLKGVALSRLIVAAPATGPASVSDAASTQPSSDGGDRLLKYYDHRIAADPTSRSNYTVKIAYLLAQHRKPEAMAACRTAARMFPDWWRPQAALAIFADADERKQAGPRFRKWVEAHPAFIHYWYLCRYDRDIGRDDDAVAALRSAVKYPLENVDDDETWVPAAFAFDAASYAYRQKQFALVLEITRVWSSPRGVYNYFDDDIYAFRAAAELALGRFNAAKSNADKVVTAASQHAIWAEHLAELKQAADARNQNFVYDPGSLNGDGWTVFPPQ